MVKHSRASGSQSPKRLYRSGENRVIAGICGGIGEYLNVDPTVIRLLWIVLTIATMGLGGIILYLFAWAIIPKNPRHKWV